MIKIGLTGSIAMGKSTTAQMFRDAGVPVHDADACVHEMYRSGGEAVESVRRIAPTAVIDDGVDRASLRRLIAVDRSLLGKLEAIVHPLVASKRDDFLRAAAQQDAAIVVFDVPLLFETGAVSDVDVIVVVTASPETQRERALARPGMTADEFERILAKQTPDAEKRRQADFIIDTDGGLAAARRSVDSIIQELKRREDISIRE